MERLNYRMDTSVTLAWSFWLTSWNPTPSLYIGTVLVLGLYFYALGPLRKRYHLAEKVESSKVAFFVVGVFIIFLALVSPIDALGDNYLFSAHMVQHLLITLIGPMFMLLGIPGWLISPLLRKRPVYLIVKGLTYPAVAFVLYSADFWLWHAPALYDATLVNDNVHILEHLTFLFTAFLFWWPIFSPAKELPRLSVGGQVLYIFLSGMPMVALGAGLTFSSPLYAPYIQAPRLWGLSAATDQQLGGLIMWIPGGILSIIVMSVLFIRWMQLQDVKQRVEDARMFDNVGGDDDDDEVEIEDGSGRTHVG